MTAAEAKQEFEKLARDNGLSDDQVKAVLQAFDNEKFAGGVAAGYTRHSEYSRALDKTKDLEGKLVNVEKWYNEQAVPALTNLQQVQANLSKYEALYGKLDDAPPGDKRAAAAAAGISREELDKILEQRTNALTAAVVDYERLMGDIRLGHFQRFNEVLPVKEMEKFMRENQITDLERGYELFAKPRVAELDKAAQTKREKEMREEIERDIRSRYKLPAEPKPPATTPFEDLANARASKDYNEHEADQKARSAFLDSMREDWSQKGNAA